MFADTSESFTLCGICLPSYTVDTSHNVTLGQGSVASHVAFMKHWGNAPSTRYKPKKTYLFICICPSRLKHAPWPVSDDAKLSGDLQWEHPRPAEAEQRHAGPQRGRQKGHNRCGGPLRDHHTKYKRSRFMRSWCCFFVFGNHVIQMLIFGAANLISLLILLG